MMKDQKEIYTLIKYLRDCPQDFLEFNHQPGTKPVTEALVYDLFRKVMGNFNVGRESMPDVGKLAWQLGDEEYRAIHIGVWFFHHPLFAAKTWLMKGILAFLFERLPELTPYVKSLAWLEDEDRAEEFVREALRCCNMLIDGETEHEAQDRLDALSSIKRQQVLAQTNESLARMKAIRQAMAEKKAREAANVYGRE